MLFCNVLPTHYWSEFDDGTGGIVVVYICTFWLVAISSPSHYSLFAIRVLLDDERRACGRDHSSHVTRTTAGGVRTETHLLPPDP